MGFEGKVKGRRKAPYPNSILDRKALTEALEEAGISVKRNHMDEFYKILHKQRYPPLPQFVENYYANDGGKDKDNSAAVAAAVAVAAAASSSSSSRPSSRPQRQSNREQSAPVQTNNNNNNNHNNHHHHHDNKTATKKRKTKTKLNLPRALLDYIATTPDFVNTTSRVKERFTSADRSTTKLIVELYDGFVVESVLMRYLQKGAGRASLCVSSQCGCAMGCTFCATGTMGLSGNLTSGEILEQLVHADRLLAEESASASASANAAIAIPIAIPIRAEGESKDGDECDGECECECNDEENNGARGNGSNNNNNNNTNNNRNSNKHKHKNKEKTLESVRNVVFMGMGEPLDNYANVTEACRTMIDRSRWNLAHGRVTVSTVGLISQIRRLTRELPEVSLALSLHAPNQKDREAIVPTASRYPVKGLIDALDNHMMAYLNQKRERENKTKLVMAGDGGAFEYEEQKQQQQTNGAVPVPVPVPLRTYTAEERMKESSRRRAMIEYVMLEGASSSFKCAHELGKLCENRHLVVNLIPYNATDVRDKLRCPSDQHMLEFRNIVQSYGAFVTIRRTMGADIASACGQLVQKKNKERDERNENEAAKSLAAAAADDDDDDGRKHKRNEEVGAVDIEDVVVGRNDARANKRTHNDNNNDTGVANTAVNESNTTPPRVEGARHNESQSLLLSWTESLSDDDLDRWSKILTIATTVSAGCFLASSALYLKRRK